VGDTLVSSEKHYPLQLALFHAKIFKQPLTFRRRTSGTSVFRVRREGTRGMGMLGAPRSMDQYILLSDDFFGISDSGLKVVEIGDGGPPRPSRS
jgi:hypothetical protein